MKPFSGEAHANEQHLIFIYTYKYIIYLYVSQWWKPIFLQILPSATTMRKPHIAGRQSTGGNPNYRVLILQNHNNLTAHFIQTRLHLQRKHAKVSGLFRRRRISGYSRSSAPKLNKS